MEPIAIATTPEDIAYVRAGFVPLAQLARGRGEHAWPGVYLPRASYALADGSAWYPRDWWRMVDDAGAPAAVHGLFVRRVGAAAALLDHACDPEDEWQAYLAGLYGACLRDVTPETLVYKECVAARVTRQLASPRPTDDAWCSALRADVEALDGLTRPFAACDRVRFGRATSRERLIDAPRRMYPHAFARAAGSS